MRAIAFVGVGRGTVHVSRRKARGGSHFVDVQREISCASIRSGSAQHTTIRIDVLSCQLLPCKVCSPGFSSARQISSEAGRG